MSNTVANRWSERGGGVQCLAVYLAALIGGVLAEVLGVRGVFVAAGGVVLLAATLAWVMFRGISGRHVPAQAAPRPDAA